MTRLNESSCLAKDGKSKKVPQNGPCTINYLESRNTATTLQRSDFSIVAVDKFIHATRDSGYKGTSNAVAEIVDNAIQASAKRISIIIAQPPGTDRHTIEVRIQDDGIGMDPSTLRHALRFGGSTRFNDRTGLGRYGMGLPNSSLSQARRVMVYTWQSPSAVIMSYLDVDKIAAGEMTEVPPPCSVEDLPEALGKSGTIVAWSRCDRLDFRRVTTISRKLLDDLGRRFRYFISSGVTISVNGDRVEPIDPLYLNPRGKFCGAAMFGHPVDYEIQAELDDGTNVIGNVRVTFSELPVHEWYKFSNDEKRRIGISKGAGVSIVRAGREVDYGWFFLGGKTRENYDDWWRCEIQFDPILDEAFGISHTKQQVRPKAYLMEALSPDIESAARALNSRARKAHLAVKTSEHFSESEKMACEREKLLPPLPSGSRPRDQVLLDDLNKRNPSLRKLISSKSDSHVTYKIVEAGISDTSFYNYARQDGRLILVLNPHHPFYKLIYKQLADSDEPRDLQLRTKLELLLIAAARSEANENNPRAIAQLERRRQLWSDTLATFLNG